MPANVNARVWLCGCGTGGGVCRLETETTALRIGKKRFEVAPGTGSREFRLKLTLVQAMRHESVVSGLAQITIAGSQGGAPRKYTVGELLDQPRAQLPFSLRYFQTLEQLVTLPEGFEPHETGVRLQSSKLRGGPIEQSFSWKVAASGTS